jgi:hypothetical protein
MDSVKCHMEHQKRNRAREKYLQKIGKGILVFELKSVTGINEKITKHKCMKTTDANRCVDERENLNDS